MKNSIFILALFICCSSVFAENLFQNNNPFPQTNPQTMNNIYEAEPATIQKEFKQAKKSKIKKGKNIEQQNLSNTNTPTIPVYPVVHEGVEANTDFYMFTTGQ